MRHLMPVVTYTIQPTALLSTTALRLKPGRVMARSEYKCLAGNSFIKVLSGLVKPCESVKRNAHDFGQFHDLGQPPIGYAPALVIKRKT